MHVDYCTRKRSSQENFIRRLGKDAPRSRYWIIKNLLNEQVSQFQNGSPDDTQEEPKLLFNGHEIAIAFPFAA